MRPRCSAVLEEGRCHLTYDVPETSGTLLRSIIYFRSALRFSYHTDVLTLRVSSNLGYREYQLVWYQTRRIASLTLLALDTTGNANLVNLCLVIFIVMLHLG